MIHIKPLAVFSFASSLLALSNLTGSSARAEFDPALTLSAAGQSAFTDEMAMNANGDSFVAWPRFDGTINRIQGRGRPAGGSFSPVVNISPAGQQAYAPDVAVDSAGKAFVVWHGTVGSTNRIFLRTRTVDGTLGPVETVFPNFSNSDSRVAVNVAGDVMVGWLSSNGRMYARLRSASGTYGPAVAVSPADENPDSPQIAIGADGVAVAMWRRTMNNENVIKARIRSAAGTWGPIDTFAVGQEPQLAMNEAGKALIVWSSSGNFNAAERPAGGDFGSIFTVSTATETVGWPRVAMNASGAALFVWSGSSTAYRVKVRARSAAGVNGPIKILTATTSNAVYPGVAMNAGGDGVIVYRITAPGISRIYARTRSAADVLSPPEVLSGNDATLPQVGLATDGSALAVWTRTDDNFTSRVQAAVGTIP